VRAASLSAAPAGLASIHRHGHDAVRAVGHLAIAEAGDFDSFGGYAVGMSGF
jgi:hypothetical protein